LVSIASTHSSTCSPTQEKEEEETQKALEGTQESFAALDIP
jgi:hypothetical protein